MSEHLKTQRRFTLSHIVFLLLKFKGHCNPAPSTSNATKIAQFDKTMRKIWDIWCKGFQCLVLGELNRFRFLA